MEKSEDTQRHSTNSFWDRALVVAFIVALLGGVGYVIKSAVIEKDRTDLVVRAEAFEQMVPLAGPAPTYGNLPVYCEAVRYQLIISHNHKGTRPVRIKRLSLEAMPVEMDEEDAAALNYTLDASALLGAGIVQLREYAFFLDGPTVSGHFLESRSEAMDVDPENIFRTTRGTMAVTMMPEGEDSFVQPVIVVETSRPGLYRVRHRLDYEIAGKAQEQVTPWVYVFGLP